MKKTIVLITSCLLFISFMASAQITYHLDVEGDSKIDGRLHINKGNNNVLIGSDAGVNNTGTFNVFLGNRTGENNTGSNQVFIGNSAGLNNTTGNSNTFIGQSSGGNNTGGSGNAFVGYLSGLDNTTGFDNTFIGQSSGGNNTVGVRNVFMGFESGLSNVDGDANTFIGYEAQSSNPNSERAIAIGTGAVVDCNNCAVIGGTGAGAVNLGVNTTAPTERLDINGKIAVTEDTGDEMVIINGDTWEHINGLQTFDNGGSNFIMASKEGAAESGGIYGDGDCVTVWSPGDGVAGNNGALLAVCDEDRFDAVDTDPYNNTALIWYLTESGGWIASDINRKENINAFANALDKISQLDVFTYNYKMNQEEVDKGQTKPEVVGIIAQELYEVIPQAVNITENGEHFVNYNQVTPVLIGAVKELSAENKDLKTRLAELEAAVEALTRE